MDLIEWVCLGEGPPLDDGYIESAKPREQVRQDPYALPRDFEWTVLDINDPKQVSLIPQPSKTLQLI